ncbi:winged helix-turn-helix domain-containing protein [Paraburkholderia heleia]|uniref:winged helix-turn-helix domain-containing protein n=1 Tax=Paraburkholderia heleia TaxID=634127 RepID=UPI0005A61EE5|nr:response regulator transcription factor [Paraburkholderia heleia]
MKWLLVGDDESSALPIIELMQRSGHDLDWASSAYEAELGLLHLVHELVLIDFGSINLNPLRLLRGYRRHGGTAVVIAVLPQDQFDRPEIVIEEGADHYLMQPFEAQDLGSRVRELMCRSLHERGAMSMGKLGIDIAGHRVTRDGMPVTLRHSEYRLLIALANEPTRVFTRSELAFHLYGRRRPVAVRAVDLVVNDLRDKLGAQSIMTVRGVGYRMPCFL